MTGDVGSYRDLPRLRAELSRLRAAGKAAKAGELARRVIALEKAAKRAATEVVTERKQLKRRFELLAGEIRDIKATGTSSEETRLRLRRLQVEAKRLQERHGEANERVRAFRWYLTGVDGDAGGAPATGASPTTRRESPAPRDATAVGTETAVGEVSAGGEAAAGTSRVGGRWSRRLPPPGFEPSDAARPPAPPAAIAAAAVIVLLIGGALIGTSRLLDARLAAEVEPIVARLLTEAGLDDGVSYARVTVSTLGGEIGMDDVVAEEPASGTRLSASRVAIRAPRLELLRARARLATPGAPLPAFSRVEFRASNAELAGAGVPGATLAEARVSVEGNVGPDLLAATPETQLAALRRLGISLTDLDLPLAASALDTTGSFRWLADPAALSHLDDLALELRHDPAAGRIEIERYLLRSPLLEQNASGALVYRLGPGDRLQPASVTVDFDTSTTYTADAVALGDPERGTQLLADLPALTIAGGLAFDYDELGNAINAASLVGAFAVTAGPMGIALPDERAPGFGMLFPSGEDSFRLDRLVLDASIPGPGVVEIGEMAVASSLITMALRGNISFDTASGIAPGRIAIDGSVEELPDAVREQLGALAASVGAALPANGAFTFAFELDDQGEPRLSIE